MMSSVFLIIEIHVNTCMLKKAENWRSLGRPGNSIIVCKLLTKSKESHACLYI